MICQHCGRDFADWAIAYHLTVCIYNPASRNHGTEAGRTLRAEGAFLSPWARRAVSRTLPADAHGARAFVR